MDVQYMYIMKIDPNVLGNNALLYLLSGGHNVHDYMYINYKFPQRQEIILY